MQAHHTGDIGNYGKPCMLHCLVAAEKREKPSSGSPANGQILWNQCGAGRAHQKRCGPSYFSWTFPQNRPRVGNLAVWSHSVHQQVYH